MCSQYGSAFLVHVSALLTIMVTSVHATLFLIKNSLHDTEFQQRASAHRIHWFLFFFLPPLRSCWFNKIGHGLIKALLDYQLGETP